ncbi:MAG: hypothetical protein JWN70_2889 [Planctomycetaceae bacterium]|nr:hypothetical protein [Planctomycetaceae bacterium]
MSSSDFMFPACTRKTQLAVIALSLWLLSLALPVFAEGGAGHARTISGFSVLLATLTWGIFVGIGIPWAVMNLGLPWLVYWNINGGSSRVWARWFSAGATLLTIATLLIARDYPQWHWTGSGILRIGVLPWTASMFVIASATALPPPTRLSSIAKA